MCFPDGRNFNRRFFKRPAFSLAELMVSLAVFSLAASALTASFLLAAKHMESVTDYNKAAARAAAVEAFLLAPATYCGFGMPLEPERYRESFGDMQGAPFCNWDGPVSVAEAGGNSTNWSDRRKDSALYIAYAMPGSSRTNELTLLDDENRLIRLDSAPADSELKASAGRSLICFGSAIPPGSIIKVANVSGRGELTADIPPSSRISIQPLDRMHLFRAMTVFAYRDILYTNDFSGSGRQPRLCGVCDLRFKVDVQGNKLIVYALTRGDKKYHKPSPVKGLEHWPKEYLEDIHEHDANYLLLVTKLTLELPNCRPLSILNSGNAEEAF